LYLKICPRGLCRTCESRQLPKPDIASPRKKKESSYKTPFFWGFFLCFVGLWVFWLCSSLVVRFWVFLVFLYLFLCVFFFLGFFFFFFLGVALFLFVVFCFFCLFLSFIKGFFRTPSSHVGPRRMRDLEDPPSSISSPNKPQDQFFSCSRLFLVFRNSPPPSYR